LGIILEYLGHPDFRPVLDKKTLANNTQLKIPENSFIVTTGLKYYLN